MRIPGPLLLVTDRHIARRPLPSLLEDCIRAGATWIWLRDRDMPAAERKALARTLQQSGRDAHGDRALTLSIGDDVDLALELGASGVHLSSRGDVRAARVRLGSDRLLGLSAHGRDDVLRAKEDGADYATLSPIYATASKPGYGPALGQQALRDAASLGLPIVALGGIDASRAAACLAAGASAVAVMGGVLASANPSVAVRDILFALT